MNSKVVLVTGADGFVGSYLVKHLLNNGYQAVHGTYFSSGDQLQRLLPVQQTHQVNLENQPEVEELLASVNPDWIIHLAARAAVGSSFEQAEKVLLSNTKLQLAMLEAMRSQAPTARLLAIGSAQAYGILPTNYQNRPLDEKTPFYPSNPYAVSKLTQEMLSRSYQLSYDLDIVMARPFNQIGPGQTADFVVPAFAQQIVEIENGQRSSLQVGNLDAVRDFTDVRDAVVAYETLMSKAPKGEVYNLGSGHGVSIQAVLDILIQLSSADVKVEVDAKRLRPSDVPFFVADNSKLRNLGWEPKIELSQTLQEVMEYERQNKQENKE